MEISQNFVAFSEYMNFSKIKQQVFCSFVVSCFANSIYCDDDMSREEKVKIADQTKLSQKEHREYLITKEFWPGSDGGGGGSGRAQGGGAVGLKAAGLGAAVGCRAGSCLSERKWQILLLDNETSLFVYCTALPKFASAGSNVTSSQHADFQISAKSQ